MSEKEGAPENPVPAEVAAGRSRLRGSGAGRRRGSPGGGAGRLSGGVVALVERVAGRFRARRAAAAGRGVCAWAASVPLQQYPATTVMAGGGGDPDGSVRPIVHPLSRRR
jgi:hypothetical protein